jgi:GTPase SAR1 family protein
METTAGQTTGNEALRQGVLGVLQRLTEKGREFELPAPPPALAECRQRLLSDGYTVLVVGEAKRGKSTLVNALIGRPYLPTAVDIATSQVFRVSHAAESAFRLRFEDGSQRSITAEELPLFGSQVAEDSGETPRLDQLIRWIEVEVPIRFLPRGMNLMDTPGLGSLYAPHAQITQRFIPHADAVLFILDSSQPVGQLEIEFLDAILKVTRNVFFIQTMIDLHGREQWQEMQRRNQAILAERFGDKLADSRVWPISSKLLLKGGQEDDEDYVMVSRHKDLAAALQAFLFRVAGHNRYGEALAVADGYYRMAGKALAGRLESLGEKSRGGQAEMQQRSAQRKSQFEADWGERGRKRNELRENIRRAMALGKQGFSQALQPGNDIASAQEARIDALTSIKEANALGESMAGDVTAAVGAAWQRVCAQVQARCMEQLQPFVESVQEIEDPQDVDLSSIDMGKSVTEFKDDWWIRIRGAYSSASVMIGIAHFFPPLLPLVPLAALWAIARGGWKDSGGTQVKGAQQELRRHLGATLQRVRRHFLDMDAASGSYSLVDTYFNDLERLLFEQIQAVVDRESEQARSEIARLIETAKLDEQQRAARAVVVKQQLVEWEGLGRSIAATVEQLKSAGRPRTPAPAPVPSA